MGKNLMKIILLAGPKQSGKTSTATAIYGYHLTSVGAIPNATIDNNGKMSIIYKKETNEGIYFDIDDKSENIVNWRNKFINHHINHVGFADELKRVCVDLFDLDYAKITGTNEQKNEPSHILWENMLNMFSGQIKKELKSIYPMTDARMTNREFMEVFGTFVCRYIWKDCHISSAYKRLMKLDPEIGIIPDCRFDNEFEYFEKIPDVIKIKFKRNPYNSKAKSETGLDQIADDRFDLVIDNDNLSLADKNNLVINYLIKHGVLSKNNIKVD